MAEKLLVQHNKHRVKNLLHVGHSVTGETVKDWLVYFVLQSVAAENKLGLLKHKSHSCKHCTSYSSHNVGVCQQVKLSVLVLWFCWYDQWLSSHFVIYWKEIQHNIKTDVTTTVESNQPFGCPWSWKCIQPFHKVNPLPLLKPENIVVQKHCFKLEFMIFADVWMILNVQFRTFKPCQAWYQLFFCF